MCTGIFFSLHSLSLCRQLASFKYPPEYWFDLAVILFVYVYLHLYLYLLLMLIAYLHKIVVLVRYA